MKITTNIEEAQSGKPAKKTGAAQAGIVPGKPSSKIDSLSSEDKTILSGRAKELAKSEAPINQEKVDQIKRAISENKLPIDSTKIADGVIKSSLELLGKA